MGNTWQNGYKQHTDGRLWEHEKIFAKLIASNHDKLNVDTYQDFFLLDIKSALHKNWFVNFYRFCTNRAIDVVFKNLQKININPETPTFDYGFKTGIDSFDMHIKVAFNNVGVSINELRKAIINNDTLVKLQDGKYGLLTEEWLKIIAPVLLFGQISNKKVRLKRHHFPIIESLKKEVDVSSILKKRESLKEFDNIEQVELPKGSNAKLRDYQQTGFD